MPFDKLDSVQDSEAAISFFTTMVKLGDLMTEVMNAFQSRGLDGLGHAFQHRGGLPIWNDERWNWMDNGVKCEILKPGSKGWQKGKLRINVTLEFEPDEPSEPASPLDEIRQMNPTEE